MGKKKDPTHMGKESLRLESVHLKSLRLGPLRVLLPRPRRAAAGDVKHLSTLRERLKAGLSSPSRVFRKKGMSPQTAAMSRQLHVSGRALSLPLSLPLFLVHALQRALGALLSRRQPADAPGHAGRPAAGRADGSSMPVLRA